MRRALAVVILCAASAAGAQGARPGAGQDALAAIDACVPRLDPELDVGYERITARCADLAHRLERSGWAAWLPAGWKEARNELSAGSLAELRTLVARELSVPTGDGPHPSVAHLNEILAGLGPASRGDSLWAKFRGWLRDVVERNRKADNGSWIDRLIQHSGRSQTMVKLLTYGSLTLVVLLAGLIVFNELRAAGILRSRARRRAERAAARAPSPGRLSWADVEQAPLADKPRLLLELVVARLTDARRLAPSGGMTVRELTRAVKLDEAGDRARLLELARAAEQTRFSAAALPPQVVDEVVEQGRELLERLAERA